MYIPTIRPKEIRNERPVRRSTGSHEKEFSQELEEIIDRVTIESVDPDKQRKDKRSPNKKFGDEPKSNLDIRA